MKATLVFLLVVAAMCTANDTYDSAEATFNNLVSGIDFDQAVDALIPYIHSDMSVLACTAACVSAAYPILGAAAPLAGAVCAPLCDGALAKLEEQAG